jgi:hypothetical protein
MDNGVPCVAHEARFVSEAQLHQAIAAHAEVLPCEDVGLGPLVAVANELELGGGYMDLLAVDANGRFVIVEFKRGVENPDVRKVVAQVLDYGSCLWGMSYDDLEQRCRTRRPGFGDTLAMHVEDTLRQLNEPFDEDVFRDGSAKCLQDGSFVFLYVGRDMDERTRRIMRYLADGARMTFFALEVDHFNAGDTHTSVLVPRTAFVPSWVMKPDVDGGTSPPPQKDTLDLLAKMDGLALEKHLTVANRRAGRVYLPRTLEPVKYANSGVGVYSSQRGMEVNLSVFRAYGEDAVAESLGATIGKLTSVRAGLDWPAVPCAVVVSNWASLRDDVIVPYFEARAAHASMTPIVAEEGGTQAMDLAAIAVDDAVA